jgi:hypothetical protein
MKSIIKLYTQPAFLICVAVLAIAGTGKTIVIEWSGAHLKKLPLPLKKPLGLLDESALAPYQVVNKHKIDNKDVLEQLGTAEYVQWELEDTQADKPSPVRYCSLFVTYYTGNPDRVPHVPEECYVGGGSQRLGSESVALNVEGLVSQSSNMWERGSRYPVLYFFKTNGAYAGSRTETRAIMGKNLFGKYSYFSKVEWKFHGRGTGGRIYPNKEEAIAVSGKFLSTLLPVMERDHWPDWEKANSER